MGPSSSGLCRPVLTLPATQAGVPPVVVDCASKMPSGKTVFERFFPGRNITEPFFFLVANKDTPRALAVASNKQVAADALVKFAVEESAPQVTVISSAEQFKSSCLKKKQCAVFLAQGDLSSKDQKIVNALVHVHRRASFVVVNTNRFTTTFDSILPPGSTPMVVYMRQEAEDARPRKSIHEPNKPMWEAKAFRGDKWSKEAVSARPPKP